MAAESVSEGELAALHGRITRTATEMRARWRRRLPSGPQPSEPVTSAVFEVARALRAVRTLAQRCASARSTTGGDPARRVL